MDKREIPLGKKFCGVSMHELHHYTEIESEVEDFLDLQNLVKELLNRFSEENIECLKETWLVPFVDENRLPGQKIEQWFSVKVSLKVTFPLPKFVVTILRRETVLAMHSPEMKYFVALSKPTYAEAIRNGKFV